MNKTAETAQSLVLEEARLEAWVPEPTAASVEQLARLEANIPRPIPHPIPIPFPIPFILGSRFMIWKQDPTVSALGRRLAYLRRLVLNGPRDARINTTLPGTTPVVRNVAGDFIFGANTPESDCAHTFAVIRQALTMWEQSRGGTPIPWAWNVAGNTAPITNFPRGFTGANAFYSRNAKSLRFGFFAPSGGGATVFTCRSLDITAHETGHAVLDGLKPGWLGAGNVPQTGALHESFGDLSAIFLALTQFDQVEALVALTRANLHAKNFLAAVAEQFGSALGRPSGLRNADNNLRLSQVSNQVHQLSQVFTGAIYDILADIYAFELRRKGGRQEPTQILFEVAQDLRKLVLDAIIAAPASGATFTHVANRMLKKSATRKDPPIYRTFIRNRFQVREVLVSPTPLAQTALAQGIIDLSDQKYTGPEGDVTDLEVANPHHASCTVGVVQDRTGTCGTMQLPEYARSKREIDADLKKLRAGEEVTDESLLAQEIRQLKKSFA
jgi:hypothetical protein